MDVSALPAVSPALVGSEVAVSVLASAEQLAVTTTNELLATLGIGQNVSTTA